MHKVLPYVLQRLEESGYEASAHRTTGKDSAKEFRHFLRNSLGSTNEVQVLLDMTKDLDYITKEMHKSFKQEYTILGKQLNRLIQRWRKI